MHTNHKVLNVTYVHRDTYAVALYVYTILACVIQHPSSVSGLFHCNIYNRYIAPTLND